MLCPEEICGENDNSGSDSECDEIDESGSDKKKKERLYKDTKLALEQLTILRRYYEEVDAATKMQKAIIQKQNGLLAKR